MITAQEEKTNGTRRQSVDARLKELERENKKLRQRIVQLSEVLWDWGINFEEKVIH